LNDECRLELPSPRLKDLCKNARVSCERRHYPQDRNQCQERDISKTTGTRISRGSEPSVCRAGKKSRRTQS